MLVFAALTEGRPTIPIDETLFVRIAEGEKEAFETLYTQSSSAVYAYALSILHNQEDAEDAMQETYLKIRGAAHLYQAKGRPMAWIFTIARNICLMKFRQQQHRTHDPLDENMEDTNFTKIRDTEDRAVLMAAFRILSDEEKQIVMLHAVSGLKHREIAAMMRLPLSTVLSKYNRAAKKLRKELERAL